MDLPNPPAMRVLTRLPTPTHRSIPSSRTDPQQSRPPPPSSSLDGVVVVGFVSRCPDHSSQLINRVLDSSVFGSGRLDKRLVVGEEEEVKDWLNWRRISYYHEEEKGILFLQFCSSWCPLNNGFSGPGPGPGPGLGQSLDTVLEEREFEDLQGLLFMFSVCHIIIYIQEGVCFDTHILKKFRVLQAAKHALAPYLRSKSTPPLPSRPHSSLSSSRRSGLTSTSPGKSGGTVGRSASARSLMSGLGSHTSLFPGHCIPVILFVFIDDLMDVLNSSPNMEELADASLPNQPSASSSLGRSNLPTKGSGSVVVLARPASKSDGGFKKKLQSSLEAQIRFLIKKCRTLSGSEIGQAGSRSGGASSSAPLFSLDASRTVVLLDKSTNQRGESLEYATDLVEDVLNGKANSSSLLLESHGQSANKDDISSIKDFIYRQSDILRGRGGSVAGTNSGSAVGVGMVAVAAAAAAASAASGKTFTAPELPNLDTWLSSSQLILQGVLSAKGALVDKTEGKRKLHQQTTDLGQVEGLAVKGLNPLGVTVSYLECGRGLIKKFSTLWCERALPTAKDVYLTDLPTYYATSLHEAQLEKALRAFYSVVRGPAVQLFAKKLQDDCTSIWKSGRQLCDAVSLTGKPCMHQRHEVDKPHSSGFFFLHACACGRSCQLRSDPFDFESANISSNCFSDCDKLLPAVQLPGGSSAGPVQSSSWSLIRVGGSTYYDPSKGLLQSGFSATQKFLLKWTIFLEKPANVNGLAARNVQRGPVTSTSSEIHKELNANVDRKKTGATQFDMGDIQNAVENQRKSLENTTFDNNKISFGRGLPNFTMRKPFSEVVAGSSTTSSGFPPLQQTKQPLSGSQKTVKQKTRDMSAERANMTLEHGSETEKAESISYFPESLNGISSNGSTDVDLFLQIGSNVVPMNINDGEMVKKNPSLKQAIVYVGFEHECPYGHRFLLTPDHLTELGSSYSLLEKSQVPSVEIVDHSSVYPSNLASNGNRGKVHEKLKGMVVSGANGGVRNSVKRQEKGAYGDLHGNGLVQLSSAGKEKNQTTVNAPTYTNLVKNPDEDLHFASLDDGGTAFSMLNRNIPIYINCPHCKLSKNRKDSPKIKFASRISQLHRIFLVTPPLPVVLATCPVIQFEPSCLPPSVPDREGKLQFSLGCQVVLPPESFLVLRLPFVYGVQLEDGSLHPLNAFEHQPERTAWIVKGTTLHFISKGCIDIEPLQM
uniref:Nonsense-mediated mRNA decay factor SMG8 n=1 Tax=Rhizophora mucronata TaxID=61149 RepID=A0A2P2K2P8_RHIMU